MLIEALGIAAMLASPPAWPDWRAWTPAQPAPVYRSAQRAVDNWRWQGAASLDLSFDRALKLAAGGDPGGVTRCVRLNNYWCVKRAGWAGEIAADGEGHVAFASALEGASVAALLLRRYYLDFGRKSALAIVSRWAPAQCGGPSATRGGNGAALRVVAPRGIGGTLRARWLAAHGRGGKPTKGGARPRRSVVADRPAPMLRAPSIAPGMGERAPAALALRLTTPTLPQALAGGEPKAPVAASCPAENQRIRAYAQNAAKGLADSIDADLRLFEPDGAPTERLARLLENMSAVEIGPLRADSGLVAAAVEAVRTAPRRR